jgi:hypothetical protein
VAAVTTVATVAAGTVVAGTVATVVVTGAAVVVAGTGVGVTDCAAGSVIPPLMIHARPTERIRIPRTKKTEELFIIMVLSGVG